MKIDTDGDESMEYQPGDHLGVFPSNNAALVEGNTMDDLLYVLMSMDKVIS